MKMKTKYYLTCTLGICLSCLPLALQAQEGWSLQQCIDYAVAESAKMEAQHAQNRKQSLDLRDAALNLLPSISGGSAAGYTFGRSPDPNTNTYSNTQYFGNNYSLSASMPLFSGFSGINNLRFQKYAQLKGLKDTEKQANDIAMQVLQSYYEVLYRERLQELAQEQLALSTQERTRMQRQVELGMKAAADMAEAEAKYAGDEYSLIQSQNQYDDALLLLKRFMSYPVDQALSLQSGADELSAFAASQLPTDSLYAIALSHLPQALASDYSIKQARAALAAHRGSLFPRLSLSGGYSTNYYNTYKNDEGQRIAFQDQLSNNGSQYVQVSLNIPIFSGLNRQANRQRARLDLRIAEANHQDLQQEVYKEVQQATQSLQAAIKAYEQALKQERARQLAYEVNERKYAEGLISILDLHTSSNLLLAAKAETIGNYLKMNAQRRVVAYYQGNPLVSPNVIAD